MKTSELFAYKGFQGSVEVSVEDHCLHGKILFISDVVSYEAETVDALEKEFRDAVDDYIATCAEVGKEPMKPFGGTFNVRIGSELHKKTAITATIEGYVSLNDYVKQAIEEKLGKRNTVLVQRQYHMVSTKADITLPAESETKWNVSTSPLH